MDNYVIQKDFDEFDPQNDRYALIDFKEYKGDNNSYIDVLQDIEATVKAGNDLFEWWETKAKRSSSYFDRFLDAIELKPGVYGFSFDLKKFFKLY